MSIIYKQIPNIITLLNLSCGFFAVVFLWQGNYQYAVYLILLACILDFLDGFFAKILHAASEIGKQLDSLADMVSFGLVPGMVFYILMNEPLQYFAVFIPIAAAIRLAIFNIKTAGKDFHGLATPSVSLVSVSLLWMFRVSPFLKPNIWSESVKFLDSPIGLLIMVFTLCALMLLPIRMFSLKIKSFSLKTHTIQFIFLLVSLIALVIGGVPVLFYIIVLYLIMNLLFFRKI